MEICIPTCINIGDRIWFSCSLWLIHELNCAHLGIIPYWGTNISAWRLILGVSEVSGSNTVAFLNFRDLNWCWADYFFRFSFFPYAHHDHLIPASSLCALKLRTSFAESIIIVLPIFIELVSLPNSFVPCKVKTSPMLCYKFLKLQISHAMEPLVSWDYINFAQQYIICFSSYG